jgi:hypothetical protein
MNCVTPKAAPKLQLLFNKPNSIDYNGKGTVSIKVDDNLSFVALSRIQAFKL